MECKNLECQAKDIKNINDSSETNVFESCALKESKIHKLSLGNVSIHNCIVENDSFSDVDLSYGEGIYDNQVIGCGFTNPRVFNLAIMRNTLINNSFNDLYFSHDEISEDVFTQTKASSLILTAVKVKKSKFDYLELSDTRIQYSEFSNNSYVNTTISHGRIRGCKFVEETINDMTCSDIKFTECVFDGISFLEASFEQCVFQKCKFLNCKMTEEQKIIFGVEE